MKRQSIYISLPITGHEEATQREKAGQISTMLSEMGYDTVINPFDLYDALKCEIGREPEYEEIMQADLAALKLCDAIFMCTGWETSAGCIRERQQAINQGQTILYEESA